MTFECILFHVATGDLPVLSYKFCTTELRDLLIAETLHPAFPAVGKFHALLLTYDRWASYGDHAHVLHATGNDDVLSARSDSLGCKVHSLLGGTALAAKSHTGYRFRQAGSQPSIAGDIRGLRADLTDAT